MKKFITVAVAMMLLGATLISCDNNKTYAEQLEEENKAVEKYFGDSAVSVISLEAFMKNDKKTKSKAAGDKIDEFVDLNNGVYMQIIKQGEAKDENKFVNGDDVLVRYKETNVQTGKLGTFNIYLEEYAKNESTYLTPGLFRYNIDIDNTATGTFVQQPYLWQLNSRGKSVPNGWLVVLPYLYDGASLNIMVKSKLGHDYAQQQVIPYLYYIENFTKRK